MITKFRLEKKDPFASISDPVKPIVFYISREVPEKWRPYIKKAVSAWQVAFEQAGFSDAIYAVDAPSLEEDPTWSPENAQYNVIRWVPSRSANAMGPHVSDPRSGEILNAHILIWHNVLQLVQSWYFTQVGCLDPRAQRLPLPDDLLGELLEFVVCHEVGHSLGLRHNFKASSAYTIEQLRDPEFTRENGISASIMDYARFNYVAQPGDGAVLIGKIGPYDKYAIELGYKPISGAKTPEDELPAIREMLARKDSNPSLRWQGDMAAAFGMDPSVQTEDLGNNPIEATKLGLNNIERVAKMIIPATIREHESTFTAYQMGKDLRTQRLTELLHVVNVVGGGTMTDYTGHANPKLEEVIYISAAEQRKAVRFVLQEMKKPHGFDREDLGRRRLAPRDWIEADARNVLEKLLFKVPILVSNAEYINEGAYTIHEFAEDFEDGVWEEIDDITPKVDPLERRVQYHYLELMDSLINTNTSEVGLVDMAIIQRTGRLKALAEQIDKAIPRAKDVMTVSHLKYCRKYIEDILLGKTPYGKGSWFRGGQ